MKVLVGCEFSCIVRDAFIKKGHDAWSCDLLPAERGGNHYQCDVREILDKDWDLGIFHPNCQRLCNSGVRWLAERNLWKELDDAADFFNLLKNAPIPKICVENPIPHKYALAKIGKYSQIIQPHWFGDEVESKQTCLWLKNLPLLVREKVLPKEKIKQSTWLASPGPNRWKERSRTFQSVATAMANTWG